MKPGRELDALVAEHVMGRCAHSLVRTGDHYQCRKCGEEFWGIAWHEGYCAFPSYSTDIAAAWAVDKPGWLWGFQEMPGTLTVRLYRFPEKLLLLKYFSDYHQFDSKEIIVVEREWLDDKARTYAWLRCLAALQAAGVEAGS